jgi:general secretion pathway protein D
MRAYPLRAPVTCAAIVALLAGLAAGQDQVERAGGQPNGRRVLDGPPTKLAFKDVSVDQLVPFIVESTGKVVMIPSLLTQKVTIISDAEVDRNRALDLIFQALQQSGVGVVEREDVIILRALLDVLKHDVPVIPGDVSVLGRTDDGAMAEKVYTLRHTTAEELGDALDDIVPEYAKVTVNEESNQIAILGNIALLKRMEQLISAFDRPGVGALGTETFRLRYADAELIAEQIETLYRAEDSGRQQPGGRNQPQFLRGQQNQPESTATSGEMRVSSNTQQNSVTVVAERAILDQIREQISSAWDLPIPEEAITPRIYNLENSDPVRVRDLLNSLFGNSTSGALPGGAGGAGAQNRPGQQGQGAGAPQGGQGAQRLAGQFTVEAIPESGRLVVVAKTPDNLAVIDQIIRDIDQPQTVGLPTIVPLKHANAEELGEQLNALLAMDGTLAEIRRSESGLSEQAASASPFAQQSQQQQTGQEQPTAPDMIPFWWQRSQPPTSQRGASNLIGQLRIVPVWRQNALMVLSPPEYKNSVVDLIHQLDQPGRQVLIKAIIVEMSRDDASALGLRWSSNPINLSRPDNSIGISAAASATENNIFGNLFDTSVLSVDTNLNVVLQALAEKTDVAVLSEPKIFTSDNQEAEFFDGQDIPFITDAQTTDVGGVTQTFDYRAVGIQLRARPRITPNNDVDLRVNVELSSVAPGQQAASGQVIVDRRETSTQLIIASGQTIVISGILRNEESEVVRKVPILGDIPILNLLFRSKETARTQSEVLVFITPVVVNNQQDSDFVNDPLRQRLREQREHFGLDPDPVEFIGPPATRPDGEQ